MGDHLGFERYHWFDRQVRKGTYPNTTALANQFEISSKTAARAIAFMRDRLGAPLEYDASRKGYLYADDSFELPGYQVSQEELLAALVARRMLAQTARGLVAEAIQSLSHKLRLCLGGSDLSEERFDTCLSASWDGYSLTPPGIFRTALDALLFSRVLEIDYRSPENDTPSRRSVEPHHLKHYLGSWILTAWCRLRADWRAFYLSRIDRAEDTSEAFAPRPDKEWRHRVEGGFGVFQGKSFVPVTLRFTPVRARWVRDQVWHPDQKLTPRPDKSLDLTFPVADFREVKMKILSFGADVEVVEPKGLKEEVAAEVRRLAGLYSIG